MTVDEAALPHGDGPDAVGGGGPRRSVRARFEVWWSGYWYEPMPVRRLDAVARILFVTIIFITLSPDHWVIDHGDVPTSWYQPVLVARILQIPAPTPTTIAFVQTAIVVACALAMLRVLPRLTSAAVFAGVSTWIIWAFSYGKVDHDRLTIVVALLALALTPRKGPDVEARTGWAIRLIQVTFALAYPFSAIVKLQTAGFEWANGAVFARAIIRRDGLLGDVLIDYPALLRAGQWAFICFELFAVVLLCRNTRLRAVAIVGVLGLHAFTYATIGISFLPHTICIVAFFPLEKLGDAMAQEWERLRRSARSRSSGGAATMAASPPETSSGGTRLGTD